jgi:hypothetical protein
VYLPDEIAKARVLVTVKTYPLPSSKYEELVCTAGILEDGKWIRIYPIPFRSMSFTEQYKKYQWVELDLIRNKSDFRPESYRPKQGFEEKIRLVGEVNTKDDWAYRKSLVLKETFTSMNDLIALAKGENKKSLATLKPAEIIDFIIEPDEREWRKDWVAHFNQLNLFERDDQGRGKEREIIRKVPYKFSYKFMSEGDQKPRKLMIEDWEIGALYWNCLEKAEGDEYEANRKVREKYFDYMVERDLYLFLGTTKLHHNVSPSPFIIIGLFYPPKVSATQLTLF